MATATVQFTVAEEWEAAVTSVENVNDGNDVTFSTLLYGGPGTKTSIRLRSPAAVAGTITSVSIRTLLDFQLPAGRTVQLATLYTRESDVDAWVQRWQGNPESLTDTSTVVPVTSFPDLQALIERYDNAEGSPPPPPPPTYDPT